MISGFAWTKGLIFQNLCHSLIQMCSMKLPQQFCKVTFKCCRQPCVTSSRQPSLFLLLQCNSHSAHAHTHTHTHTHCTWYLWAHSTNEWHLGKDPCGAASHTPLVFFPRASTSNLPLQILPISFKYLWFARNTRTWPSSHSPVIYLYGYCPCENVDHG